MARLVSTRQALARLDLIRSHIAQFGSVAAERVGQRLLDAGSGLAEHPDRLRPIGSERRELPTVAPHVIRYRPGPGRVFIPGIRHGAQRQERS